MKKPSKHILWALPLVVLISVGAYLLVSAYVRTNIDTTTSAKPEADKLLEGITRSQGTVLHTYNRNSGGSLNKVREPSFEYYVLYDGENTKYVIDKLARTIEQQGYNVATARYQASDPSCLQYAYSPNRSVNDESGNALSAKEYCQKLTGVDNSRLFGRTENQQQPYHTLYATSQNYSIYAEATTRMFLSTANDFWAKQYAEQNGLQSGEVPKGKTVLAIIIQKLKE